MGIIVAYLLFALTTGLTATYELFYPIIRELEVLNPEDVLVQYKWLSLVTATLGAMLFAPVFIGIVLTPSLAEAFRNGLVNMAVLTPEKI